MYGISAVSPDYRGQTIHCLLIKASYPISAHICQIVQIVLNAIAAVIPSLFRTTQALIQHQHHHYCHDHVYDRCKYSWLGLGQV